jgi:hypothetical protein
MSVNWDCGGGTGFPKPDPVNSGQGGTGQKRETSGSGSGIVWGAKAFSKTFSPVNDLITIINWCKETLASLQNFRVRQKEKQEARKAQRLLAISERKIKEEQRKKVEFERQAAAERENNLRLIANQNAPIPEKQWIGEWNENEKIMVNTIINSIKDDIIKNWILTFVKLERYQGNITSPINANDDKLVFKNNFFDDTYLSKTIEIGASQRVTLLAFEAGKVLYDEIFNHGSNELQEWYRTYHSTRQKLCGEIKGKAFTGELKNIADPESQYSNSLGYIFCAKVLQPQNKEWNTAFEDFWGEIGPMLQNYKPRWTPESLKK